MYDWRTIRLLGANMKSSVTDPTGGWELDSLSTKEKACYMAAFTAFFPEKKAALKPMVQVNLTGPLADYNIQSSDLIPRVVHAVRSIPTPVSPIDGASLGSKTLTIGFDLVR
jgi:hypothetical protein